MKAAKKRATAEALRLFPVLADALAHYRPSATLTKKARKIARALAELAS